MSEKVVVDDSGLAFPPHPKNAPSLDGLDPFCPWDTLGGVFGNGFSSCMDNELLLYSLDSLSRVLILIGVEGTRCTVLVENMDIAGERKSDELLSSSKYQVPTDRDAMLSAVSLVNLACWGFTAELKYKLVDRALGDGGGSLGRGLSGFTKNLTGGGDGGAVCSEVGETVCSPDSLKIKKCQFG